MGSEQKNAFMAIVLSGLILFAWQFYFAPQKKENAPIEPTTTSAPVGAIESAKAQNAAPGPI
jgi:predicted MFS family arabinose efflux permease